MRMMVQVKLSHETFNAAVRDGSAGEKLKKILDATKPEAVYFTEVDGYRTPILFVDVADPSSIPALAEPWFLTFNADVRIHPAMTAEELARSGIENLGKIWG
jgi:hypothetical protein